MKQIKKFLILMMFAVTFLVGCGSDISLDTIISDEITKLQLINASNDADLKVESIANALKSDILNSIDKSLISSVSEYETKEVNAIIVFSEESVLNNYLTNNSSMSFYEYQNSSVAKKTIDKMTKNHNEMIKKFQNENLIESVKYNYTGILDGIYVKSTYENLLEIAKMDNISRIMISNTYEAPVAVTNDVLVYETGIFDSSNVSYTGANTTVAILDTGCDYTHTAFTTHQVVNPLLDRSDIEKILSSTVAYGYDNSLEARDVYYSDKIPFGYDYADKDSDVMPFQSEHGTHVAGIVGGYDDTICGVAIDTQLIIMKVFSDYSDGAEDGDILAALEDSIKLDVDAINMSLGTSCGFTSEVDDEYKSTIYQNIEDAGISLVVAASNDYSSAYGSEKGNTNKTSNPDSATVGAPSTYTSAISVASINGNMDKYMYANGNKTVFFHESFNQNAKEYDFYEMLGIEDNKKVTFEYVTIPGFGLTANYMGVDVTGKIALVKRGDISFEEKVQYAYEAGAIACIVYNNVFGDIIMTVGNDLKIPTVSISKDDGVILASQDSGTIEFDTSNQAGPFMSDFSSWGPTPSLELKPEITAHGGNILSAIPGGGYDKLSGTSMAAPNMCGITILIRQYVKEKYPSLSTVEVRDMVNQLTMSSATIIKDQYGNPYSPRKQGAGLASLLNAVTTDAYLYVEGNNKTKLELKDDPKRTGIYEFSFHIKNTSNLALEYDLDAIIMSESLSTSDQNYVAEYGYLLNGSTVFSLENTSSATLANNILKVNGNSDVVIKGKTTLTSEDKKYMNSNFENGIYVEGFITLESRSGNVDLSIPLLAFYGDWAEAPIFDKDYYEVDVDAKDDSIDEDDKLKADYYATTPLGRYYYDYIIPLGSYVYEMDETKYDKIVATKEKSAVSYYKDSISGVYAVFTGLLRGAKEMNITVTNTMTGEVVFSDTQYNCYKAHYSGAQFPYVSRFELEMSDYLFDNNSKYEVTMSAKLDWESESQNLNDSYSFTFYVDYEAPQILNANYRKVYDKPTKKYKYYIDLEVFDNHYAQSVRPIMIYENPDSTSSFAYTYGSLTEMPIPVYQTEKGTSSNVTIEITEYLDLLQNAPFSEGLAFYIDDYAMNANLFYVTLPELDNKNLKFTQDTLEINVNDVVDLKQYITYAGINSSAELVSDYFKNLDWTTSDVNVVDVNGGIIEGLKPGVVNVSFESKMTNVKKTIVVTVKDSTQTNDQSSNNVSLEDIDFIGYETIFAFDSDNDPSEIGSTGSLQYFDQNHKISFYPTESVKLNYVIKPWNLDPDRYQLEWISSNPRIATIDQNGVLVASEEGNTRVSLRITVDGRVSTIVARAEVEVKSPFIIENRVLTEYKGKGGEVIIPDDEGIMYIGSFAFCHYLVDNDKEVEDEDDFDAKKEAIGNNTITSVVIPEGVEEIQKYAFYNCSVLQKVVLPTSVKKIFEYAFYDDDKLEYINTKDVVVIGARAFYNCRSLTTTLSCPLNTINTNTIGDEAFYGCRNITSLDLRALKRTGTGAFSNCTRLQSVLLSEWTVLSENMFENTRLIELTIYNNRVPDSAFLGCTKLTTVTFKNDLRYLGAEAFSGCTSLNKVTFEGGVEYIGGSAFYNCTNLKELTLPNSEVNMANYAFRSTGIQKLIFAENTYLNTESGSIFRDSSSLTTIDVSKSNHYMIESGIVCTKDRKVVVLVSPNQNISEITIPASVEEIASGAFSANKYIRTVNFASGSKLSKIGPYAFAECSVLTTVNLPSNQINIGKYAFHSCTYLRTINLNNVSEVNDYAFAYSGLQNATLPSNLTIGEGAFYKSEMTEVTLGANTVIGLGAFAETKIVTVNMPEAGQVTVNRNAFYQTRTLTNFDFSKVVGRIGEFAFYNCSKLTSIDLANVTVVGKGAFADCINLAEVKMPKVEVLEDSAFAGYAYGGGGAIFSEITLPDSLEYIGENCFYDCTKLKSINLNNVSYVGIQAFAYCESLEEVIINEKLDAILQNTFFGCAKLQTIDLKNVTSIGESAFYQTSLKSVIMNNVEYVGEAAFYGVSTLTSVEGKNVKTVIIDAFSNTGLTTINFPSLEMVDTSAFGNVQIEEFLITESLREVNYAAFAQLETFKGFYAIVNNEKVYSVEFENVVLDEGVLYKVLPNGGYLLTAYPTGKTAKEYTVLDNTVRIEYFAVSYNPSLEKVVLPTTLKTIGNFAFYQCTSLKEVEFNSYYAPVLEGTMTMEIAIEDTEKFTELYKYDYTYIFSKLEGGTVGIGSPLYYQNFVSTVGSSSVQELIYSYPVNGVNYQELLYRTYFTPKTSNGNVIYTAVAPSRDVIAYRELISKFPAKFSFLDEQLVIDARTAYNAFSDDKTQLNFLSSSEVQVLINAESEIKVQKTIRAINKIFDVSDSKYSFDALKNAKILYDSLSSSEKQKVTNANELNTKISEYEAIRHETFDITKEYKEYIVPTTIAQTLFATLTVAGLPVGMTIGFYNVTNCIMYVVGN